MIRLTELRNVEVRTIDGEKLGRVHDVHCEAGQVVALMAGPGSLIERLTAKTKGRRIPWDCVLKVEPRQIVVSAEPPKRKRR